MNEPTTESMCGPVETKNFDEMRVEIEPHYDWYRQRQPPEKRQSMLESWARELVEFFRDHRSMDVNSVYVVVPTFSACSACGAVWDTDLFDADPETGEPCEPYTGCASCGRLWRINR